MVDVILLAVPLVAAAIVAVRKTSAGVAILALLAGVMLDQLLTAWLIERLPESILAISHFVPLAIRMIVTLTPALVSLLAVKVAKSSFVLSLLASLLLGFLMVYFALQTLAGIPEISTATRNAGFLAFIRPYHNHILAASALLAIVEMIASHRTGISYGKKQRQKKKD